MYCHQAGQPQYYNTETWCYYEIAELGRRITRHGVLYHKSTFLRLMLSFFSPSVA